MKPDTKLAILATLLLVFIYIGLILGLALVTILILPELAQPEFKRVSNLFMVLDAVIALFIIETIIRQMANALSRKVNDDEK